MNLNKHTRQYARIIFRDYAEKIHVYLRASQIKGNDYHPKYNVAYTKTNQNPITIKAIIRDETANKLVIKNIGLTAVGAKSIIIKNSDVNTIKLAEKIVINNENYEIYNSAVGKKFQVYDVCFGYSKIIIFKSGN